VVTCWTQDSTAFLWALLSPRMTSKPFIGCLESGLTRSWHGRDSGPVRRTWFIGVQFGVAGFLSLKKAGRQSYSVGASPVLKPCPGKPSGSPAAESSTGVSASPGASNVRAMSLAAAWSRALTIRATCLAKRIRSGLFSSMPMACMKASK
jgi:hypothetical protein